MFHWNKDNVNPDYWRALRGWGRDRDLSPSFGDLFGSTRNSLLGWESLAERDCNGTREAGSFFDWGWRRRLFRIRVEMKWPSENAPGTKEKGKWLWCAAPGMAGSHFILLWETAMLQFESEKVGEEKGQFPTRERTDENWDLRKLKPEPCPLSRFRKLVSLAFLAKDLSKTALLREDLRTVKVGFLNNLRYIWPRICSELQPSHHKSHEKGKFAENEMEVCCQG